MSELAEIAIEVDGDVVVAVLRGEVDPSNARVLGRELTGAVPNDAMGVVLDLTDVDYIDSAGIQVLFEFAERLEGRQQRLAVAASDGGAARRVLEIVALDEAAPIAATRDAARALLAG